ncbi:MAG TPA: hypothetical protein DEP72_07720 [Clostridiales bacterium]|nr:MAG: hypothetical protein A2Y18_06760 [Clostridiales bacterium GWD2_32_19]HCC08024.1 hypothetical protein [Clostridiales bacterium]
MKYIFLASIVAVTLLELIFIMQLLKSRLFKKNKEYHFCNKKKNIVHIIAAIGVLCVLYGYFIEPYWVEVKYVTINTNKFADFGVRVVQISDIQSDTVIRNEKKLAEIINPLNPDIIVFTGDTINERKALKNFKSALTNLEARLGKFAVTGNVDYMWFKDLDLFSGTGFSDISNKKVVLKSSFDEDFMLYGMDYNETPSNGLFDKDANNRLYNIFLYHTPDLIENVSKYNLDLYLAGHTHGGQVRLPFYGAMETFSEFGKKYEMGEYKVGNTTLYVNRGYGLEGGIIPRVRFLCRPEITVFDIMPIGATRLGTYAKDNFKRDINNYIQFVMVGIIVQYIPILIILIIRAAIKGSLSKKKSLMIAVVYFLPVSYIYYKAFMDNPRLIVSIVIVSIGIYFLFSFEFKKKVHRE